MDRIKPFMKQNKRIPAERNELLRTCSYWGQAPLKKKTRKVRVEKPAMPKFPIQHRKKPSKESSQRMYLEKIRRDVKLFEADEIIKWPGQEM